MSPLTHTIDVETAPAETFAYVTDPALFAEWQQGVVSGRMEGEGPHHPGDICLTTRRIGFAERTVTAEVTHVHPPRAWGVRGIDGPIRATVNVTVSPLDGGRGSRVQIDLGFAGRGIGKLLVPIAVRDARKEMPANLQRLKERLERQR
jgi:uncharacterized protein YndB with AHSA1/START domain